MFVVCANRIQDVDRAMDSNAADFFVEYMRKAGDIIGELGRAEKEIMS